jgi:hypothetical protein
MTKRVESGQELLRRRLQSQRLGSFGADSPAELVRWMGAVQAQDFAGGLWGVGLRCAGATEAAVEVAIAERSIVRTWPMRRTLHFAPAEDARWMLRLAAPRSVAASRGRHRALGLEERDFARARRILARALEGGRALTRPAAYAELDRGGVSPAGQRGIHILSHLAELGMLCFGPRAGKQPTFVLLEEWLPAAREVSRDEALATLAGRYFRGHGPALFADFVWWSGLKVADARRAIEAAGDALDSERRGESILFSAGPVERSKPSRRRGARAELLPPWDEWLVGYRDRSAAVGHLDDHDARRLELLGRPLVVVDGRARGSWRRAAGKGSVRVEVELWPPFAAGERESLARAVERAAQRYSRFLGCELELRLGKE